MIDPSALAPFHLDETGEPDPSHCLYLFVGDMEQLADVFEEHNAESNDSADTLHFGSEAGTFVVSSSDRKALTDLAVLLYSAFHNRELLSQYVLTADPRFLPRQASEWGQDWALAQVLWPVTLRGDRCLGSAVLRARCQR
ncbi:Imm51 family immunity protein [Streptomyces sp. NPDC058157]|uniref:Imm51 family immunity protein n=1 Tax=Streptomyces sp. NPDC058157 TaxID=3346360 RepID=UPI0036E19B15